MIEGVIDSPNFKVDLDENGKEKLCKAAQGLTLQEAENALTDEEIKLINWNVNVASFSTLIKP